MAHVWPLLPPLVPATTAVTTPVPVPEFVKPVTSDVLTRTGRFEEVFEELPNRPSVLAPQQYKRPLSMAHVCLSDAAPDVTADVLLTNPSPACTAAGNDWLDVPPLPSRPSAPRPQQLNVPETIAQP